MVRLVFDISILGSALYNPRARTGIFRTTEHFLHALRDGGQCDIRLCAYRNTRESITYWENDPACRTLPFPHHEGDGWMSSWYTLKTKLADFYYRHQNNRLLSRALRVGAAAAIGLERIYTHWRDMPIWDDNLRFAQIYHTPHYQVPRFTRKYRGVRRFLNVHDLIPLKYPQYFCGDETARMRRLLDQLTPDDWIICPSQCTANDLRDLRPGRRAHCCVIPWAADPFLFRPVPASDQTCAIRAKYGIDERPYLLSLCTLEPRKNLRLLLRAFALLCREESFDAQLVMVGPNGWMMGELLNELSRLGGWGDRVIMPGFVADSDLAALYSQASVFVYPSLYEGFGLPVLEAMQCGTPVVCSASSSLPEVAGDAAVLFDPHDEAALAQAILNVTGNSALRADLAARSVAQAARFSWKRTAEETVAIYGRAIAGA